MTFLQKRLLPPIPRRVYWDKYVPQTISIKRKKQRKTINIPPYLASILITDNSPTTKIKKKK